MKTCTARWREVIKEIVDAIDNAEDMELPLESIELTKEEWDAFVVARTTLVNGTRLSDIEFMDGTAMYRGIRIYREKT